MAEEVTAQEVTQEQVPETNDFTFEQSKTPPSIVFSIAIKLTLFISLLIITGFA